MKYYSIGDYVYIKKDLDLVQSALKYRGVRTRIVDIITLGYEMPGPANSSSIFLYKLECDNKYWNWEDSMLDGEKEIRYNKLKRLEKLYEI